MARIAAAALALALASCATAPPVTACAMRAEDRAWLQGALALWGEVEPNWLLLQPQPLPTIAVIDDRCTYLLAQGRVEGMRARPHGGTAVLPDGAEVPVGPISFASGKGGYFAMSLPSVWRAAGIDSEFGLERLMDGVLLHEMMHVRQTELANAALADLATAAGIADADLNDDIVQQRFGGDPDYASAWGAERDLLFAAADASDDDEARQLAARALAMMRARHDRWFTGDAAAFREIDSVFLTMEGMGQWLVYRYFLTLQASGQASAEVLPAVRRGGRQWSQDHGLALMLVVDRLLPGWQQRAFRDPDWRAERLLAAAVESRAE